MRGVRVAELEDPTLLDVNPGRKFYDLADELDRMREVKTDAVVLPGWPTSQPVPGFGRIRTALATVVLEHLNKRFATYLLPVKDSQSHQELEVKWCEPVPVLLMVACRSIEIQDLDDQDEVQANAVIVGDEEFSTPLITPVRLAADNSFKELSSSAVTEMINAKLLAQMKMSALTIFRDLSSWLSEYEVVLASTVFEFGVNGSEVFLIGEPIGVTNSTLSVGDSDPMLWLGPGFYQRQLAVLARSSAAHETLGLDQLGEQLCLDGIRLYELLSGHHFDHDPNRG
jgi:phosphoribosylaminoimidazole-succinocarboxamide synthase